MQNHIEEKSSVVIRIAGDSGDGIQLTGDQFTQANALAGSDMGTLPDYPAEIRAPAGTLAGVSGFQLQFGSVEINTPGDQCDVLVVMNAAAFKSNFKYLKDGGIIIANEEGFDNKNLKLAGYEKDQNPLDSPALEGYKLFKIPVTKLVREALADLDIKKKDADKSKNMFVLGLLCWMFNRPLEPVHRFIQSKFKGKDLVIEANTKALKAGYHFGDTTEIIRNRYEVKPANLPPGTYRGITGNQATAYGLVAASVKSDLQLFFGSYPITPASDILHELSQHKNFGVLTAQMEDEIAAITSAVGAAFGGKLGVTASSGPGISLKTESISLAVMLELPLVICDIQRAGPSTGMPTKTEQGDLLMALHGRSGEAPMPVVAPASPADAFNMAFEASRIAMQHMTPVFFLSDAYLANGSEPWRFPSSADLPELDHKIRKSGKGEEEQFKPYQRDENQVRDWAIPGTQGLEHRIGGLEKEEETGNVSYDPHNHQKMVDIREEKIQSIVDNIPEQDIDSGPNSGPLAVLSWGSTYGTIKSALNTLRLEGVDAAHIHIRYLKPLPKNLPELLNRFDKFIIPENNSGQLLKYLRQSFDIDAEGLNKVEGRPFTEAEIKNRVRKLIATNQKEAIHESENN